ncbi:SDR family oxidoreductase [Variovorax sp. EBFNA2]|uniref:SDR family oxidoreductase n=1 Tax=Variovorax sp. EBFNA2 TaxID=3342097 RepID=UPI0029BFFAB2|nr:SDR family oxidoreductase [Variovorax boronicumulans]WPG40182.1 SDR family oxidoreductase [Variovorax boronicumulans]
MSPLSAAHPTPPTSQASPSPEGPADATPHLLRQVVVLTGASSGIGRATALAFASQGASLVLAARNREALQTVAADCERAGARVLVVPTDVTDPGAVSALAQAAITHFGHVDMWINNVGVGAVGRFEDTPLASHRRVVEANLLGHMHGAHAVVPHFRARGRGTLVHMISLGGWVGTPYATAYTASKFGIRGFSESLRAELADCPGIHLCEVFPTFVDSPGMSHGANYSGHRVGPPPPVVDPRRVAAALVGLATRPRARTYIGAPARPGILMHALAPNLMARLLGRVGSAAMRRAPPAERSDGNLFEPSRGCAIDGGFRKRAGPARALWLGLGALGAVAATGYVLRHARSTR